MSRGSFCCSHQRRFFIANVLETSTSQNADPSGNEGNAKIWTKLWRRQWPQLVRYACADYLVGSRNLNIPRDRILFAPFAGWDAAGAKWFGYETFWVNRLGMPPEVLGVEADGMGGTLNDLVAYLRLRA